MKSEKNFKIGVYVRVSTDEQVEKGHSLDDQIYKIEKYADSKEYDIIDYYKEEGKSGKNTKDRPEYLRMTNDILKGKINAICVYKLDRLTRNIKDLEELLNFLEVNKADLVSVTEDINTKNPAGTFFVRMTILLAQLERETIVARTKVGVEAAARDGIISGKPPLGYKKNIDALGSKEKKQLIINEDEVITVRRIFSMYLDGYSSFTISEKLIQENNKLRKWKDTTILKILSNKIYMGTIEHRKSKKSDEIIEFKDVVPSIITENIFYECQRLLEKNKLSFGGNLEYIYGKTLYCSKCGSLLNVSTVSKKNIKHYVCKKCNERINETKVEEKLLKDIINNSQFQFCLTYNSIFVDDIRLNEIINNIEIYQDDNYLKDKKDEIREILDEIVIKENVKRCDNIKKWYEMNYNEKSVFIKKTIDAIYIEKIKGKNQQDYDLKITKISFKQSSLEKIFRLIRLNIIDLYGSKNSFICSSAVINDKKELDKYLKYLNDKYNIKVIKIEFRKDLVKKVTKEIINKDNEIEYIITEEIDEKQNEKIDKLIEEVYDTPYCIKSIKINKSKEILDKDFLSEIHYHIFLNDINNVYKEKK